MDEIRLIKQLKSEYDLTKSEDVLKLYSRMQSGELSFRTKEGMDFDDEIYELVMKAKESANQKSVPEESKHKKIKNEKPTKTKEKKLEAKDVVVYTQKEYMIRRILITLLTILMLSCFGYFGVYYYNSYQKQLQTDSLNRLKNNTQINDMYEDVVFEMQDDETGETVRLKVLDEYKSLYNKNKNLIGWIKIDDTIIDYPVMQTKDNEFYLDHDLNQEPNKNGTLFLDAACDIIKPSTNFIIYGHNMRSGKMFGSLSKYKSASFYESHPYIQFDTIYEKGTYQVMYAFQSHIYDEDEVVFKYYQFIEANSEVEFDSNMQQMADIAMYDTNVTAQYGDHLLTLSTCDYDEEDGRFVVVCKQID